MVTRKYYEADSIQVLMSLKEYTELNQRTKKFWLDFMWTFKKLNEIGIGDIVAIMRLEELAGNLARDYWKTAKKETYQANNWSNLTEEQQKKLIKYWGREKARQEQELAEALTAQEKQGEDYEKYIEIAKFHEERGKIKCECWQCEERKEIQEVVKAKIKKEIDDYERETGIKDKEQCPECQKWVKELDEENGICSSCVKMYE